MLHGDARLGARARNAPRASRREPHGDRCGVQRKRERHAANAAFAALIVVGAISCATPLASRATPPSTQETPLRPPLDPPLRLTGTFGEARSSHFHAGLDFSTNERVGAPVYAPLDGHLVRVRSSGVGYGRSLYLQSNDGRLLVFGHLDAFDGPIASFIAAIQDSSGQYEQDVWTDTTRFAVTAGQRLGWSGRSGTGPPHLHFEVRHGDMAVNPLLAGIEVADSTDPVIRSVTLEPLDGSSSVEGSAAPFTLELTDEAGASLAAADPPRVRARGRFRVLVEALDRRANGRLSMAPWSIALDWRGERVECRFDSVSWAEGMAEVDLVYDRGRASARGASTVALSQPAGFRARAVHASAADPHAAGVLTLGEAPSDTLAIVARDPSGRETRRTILVVAAPKPQAGDAAGYFAPQDHVFAAPGGNFSLSEAGDLADPMPASWMLAPGELRFAALPEGWLRVEIAGKRWRERAPRALDFLGVHAIDPEARRLAVIVHPESLPRDLPLRIAGDKPRWTGRSRTLRLAAVTEGSEGGMDGLHWSVPAGALFEPSTWVATTTALVARVAELSPVGPIYVLEPEDEALRASITVGLAVPFKQSLDRLGLYRDTGDGWEFVRTRFDSAASRVAGETRRLGRFGLFRDVAAPRFDRPKPPRAAPAGAYSTWALEARITEQGSGVDAKASRFEVDGRAVPSEWDAEDHALRWRPRVAPASGRHRFRAIAVDRAGNTRRMDGTFVID